MLRTKIVKDLSQRVERDGQQLKNEPLLYLYNRLGRFVKILLMVITHSIDENIYPYCAPRQTFPIILMFHDPQFIHIFRSKLGTRSNAIECWPMDIDSEFDS